MKTVAEFAIPFLRLLEADGTVPGGAAALPAFARDAGELARMYRVMTLARQFDAKAVNLQRTGKLGTYAPCVGHEATHVGVAAAMRAEDVLFPYYREYGTQIWRGVTLAEILIYWGGDERGCDFAGPRQDFPWAVPIGSQAPHATGAGLAFRIRGEPRCAVVFIGDGGTSEGAFYEALNLAGAKRLPVLFVIVNNGWAISMPVEQQSATQTLAQKGIAAGVPGMQVDGNDVLAVRHATEQALERARRGEGATVLEALTYRLSDHTTADDATRYREKRHLDDAWKIEPLLRTRSYMQSLGCWDDARELALRAECAREIDAAVQAYQKTAPQSIDTLFDNVYAQPTRALIEQRDVARRYLGSYKQDGGSGH